jgi:hypothetical protein
LGTGRKDDLINFPLKISQIEGVEDAHQAQFGQNHSYHLLKFQRIRPFLNRQGKECGGDV